AAVIALGGLRAAADDFSAIVDPAAPVEKIAEGFKFIEGPVWHPQGWLLFSDIPSNTIYQWLPGPAAPGVAGAAPFALHGTLKIYRTPSNHSNGLALDREGRLVACEHDRRVSRTGKDG